MKFLIQLLGLFLIQSVVKAKETCECSHDLLLNKSKLKTYSYANIEETVSLDRCDLRCKHRCIEDVLKPDLLNAKKYEEICEEHFKEKSLYKDGLEMRAKWNYPSCYSNEVHLRDNICCGHCVCKISTNARMSTDKSLNIEFNIPNVLGIDEINTVRAYNCSDYDHNERCEMECRKKLSNLYNHDFTDLSVDSYEIIKTPSISNDMCERLGTDVYSDKHLDVSLRIETGPRDESWHKDINLGNICCQKNNAFCKCNVSARTSSNTVIFSKDLDSQMQNVYTNNRQQSYDCRNELKNCMDDCKEAAGIYLNSTYLSSRDIPITKFDLFTNFYTANATCHNIRTSIQQEINSPGVEIYLKYKSAFNGYPYETELLLGRICCKKYDSYPTFPYNNCENWSVQVLMNVTGK